MSPLYHFFPLISIVTHFSRVVKGYFTQIFPDQRRQYRMRLKIKNLGVLTLLQLVILGELALFAGGVGELQND